MKPCTRFHFSDLEKGDRLLLEREDHSSLTVTVVGGYTTRFGPVIHTSDRETIYLDDYDSVRCINAQD